MQRYLLPTKPTVRPRIVGFVLLLALQRLGYNRALSMESQCGMEPIKIGRRF